MRNKIDWEERNIYCILKLGCSPVVSCLSLFQTGDFQLKGFQYLSTDVFRHET